MNLPNKLCMTRLLLTPVFFLLFGHNVILGLEFTPAIMFVALGVYIIMELTDLFDGKIARRRGLVTDLGKVFDPFCDAFMHITFFLLFMLMRAFSPVAFIVVVWRELLMLFLRQLLAKTGVSFPANIFGKAKTMSFAVISGPMILVFAIQTFLDESLFLRIVKGCYWFSYVCAFLSLMSFIIYLNQIISSRALSSISK